VSTGAAFSSCPPFPTTLQAAHLLLKHLVQLDDDCAERRSFGDHTLRVARNETVGAKMPDQIEAETIGPCCKRSRRPLYSLHARPSASRIGSKGLTLNHPQPKPRQVDMPFYSLLILGENKSLFTPARDRNEALALFGRELNLKLGLDDSDTVIARYLLDEWDFPGPHWSRV
jgi:hypothetical protein